MREVFLTVPTRLKESAYALGSTKWEVSWDIVLPYTRSAVIGGIFLGLGRALGETMAVAFVIGNSTRFTASLLEPGTTIAALIANDFGEATETYRSEEHTSELQSIMRISYAVCCLKQTNTLISITHM